ncbi:MAG: hypothetical protein H7A24_01690 [Leptospiraceae bacterium]|nr:hypothetical protein [Leptospiraceae bacterium]MCP5510566.1 hypothetical protein [Leptospiraceae bacterium]
MSSFPFQNLVCMGLELPTLTEVLILTYSSVLGFYLLSVIVVRIRKSNISFLFRWFLIYLLSGLSVWFYYFFRFLNLREISPGFKSFSILLGNLAARVSVFSFLVTALFYFAYLLFLGSREKNE